MIKYALTIVIMILVSLMIIFFNQKREITKYYSNLIWFESVINEQTNSRKKDLKIKSFVWSSMENIKFHKKSILGNAICDQIESNWPLANKTYNSICKTDFSDIPEIKMAKFIE